MRCFQHFLLVVFLSLAGVSVWAQKSAFTVSGTVTDQQGEPIAVAAFNRGLDRAGRSRNPLYIPMRTADSPHVWAVDLKDSPKLLSSLRRSVGKRIRIRYKDPTLSFSTTVVL